VNCPHKRMRSTVVFLEPTGPDEHRVAVMTISCHECGTPFEFATDLILTPGVKISEDRRELRAEITEASNWMVQ
jgi:hypothetical protein